MFSLSERTSGVSPVIYNNLWGLQMNREKFFEIFLSLHILKLHSLVLLLQKKTIEHKNIKNILKVLNLFLPLYFETASLGLLDAKILKASKTIKHQKFKNLLKVLIFSPHIFKLRLLVWLLQKHWRQINAKSSKIFWKY